MIDLVMKCLEKAPQNRPASAHEALEMLRDQPHEKDRTRAREAQQTPVDPAAVTEPEQSASTEAYTSNNPFGEKPRPRLDRPLSTKTIGTQADKVFQSEPSSFGWLVAASIVGIALAAICFATIQQHNTPPIAQTVVPEPAPDHTPLKAVAAHHPSKPSAAHDAPTLKSGAGAQPPGPKGMLSVFIQSTPAGATILRDGKSVGQTPSAINLQRSDERVFFQLKLEGYQPANVSLIPDTTTHIRVPFMTPTAAVRPIR